jgi:hypothetical protein
MSLIIFYILNYGYKYNTYICNRNVKKTLKNVKFKPFGGKVLIFR